jgi:hypothetical protein
MAYKLCCGHPCSLCYGIIFSILGHEILCGFWIFKAHARFIKGIYLLNIREHYLLLAFCLMAVVNEILELGM